MCKKQHCNSSMVLRLLLCSKFLHLDFVFPSQPSTFLRVIQLVKKLVDTAFPNKLVMLVLAFHLTSLHHLCDPMIIRVWKHEGELKE